MAERIAVIGGGMAGLCGAYFLRDDFEVTLFERAPRVGGNAYTLELDNGMAVDIAVAAFDRRGYPRFFRLLDELGVRTQASRSGFISIHDLDTGRGVYLTPTVRGLIAQRAAILRPAGIVTLLRLSRALARARRLQARGGFAGLSMRDALTRLPSLRGDAETILLCALCLMSSMSGEEVLDAPADFFFGKLSRHRDVVSAKALLNVRTVIGGTRAYVSALAEALGDRVVTGKGVQSVNRDADGAELVFDDGSRERFDKVVFACNADRTLELLNDPSALERELLAPWRYKDGRLVVHRDHSAFPPDALLQAFTFLYRRRDGDLETSVNGVMRFLAGVPDDCDLIGSQHPNFPLDESKVVFDTVFRTPIFDHDACTVQGRLPELNGHRGCFHCGSHFGYGLHEDAVRSAEAAAAAVRESAAG
ncbi:MAG: FAD-dependent oxidoreductase [Actinobacteria bacterium]|nr:FAD-dependent oxidoreductase [Actinomycetota bacterium]